MLCQHLSVYWCRFADSCSFLHYKLNNSEHHTASDGIQEVKQALAELRDEVRILRLEVGDQRR